MLEILALIILSRRIGVLAASKGLKPGSWKFRLVLFWLLGEFVGVCIGLAIFGEDNVISCMLVGIAFAVPAYFIIDNYLSRLPSVMEDDINNIGQ